MNDEIIFSPVIQNKSLPHAIIVDIDGTLANHEGIRSPYDYSKVLDDKPHEDIIWLVNKLSETHIVLFVSGRSEECRDDTTHWLIRYFTDVASSLRMRKADDKRKDSIVKYEILQELIKEYSIEYVFDDRDQVVKMWREAGLRCLQVAPGNF